MQTGAENANCVDVFESKYCGASETFTLSGVNVTMEWSNVLPSGYPFCVPTIDNLIGVLSDFGFEAKKKNDDYYALLSTVINRFTRQFSEEFCKQSGEIDWAKLVKFNSGVNPS